MRVVLHQVLPNNDLSAAEYTKTDRVTLKESIEMRSKLLQK